MYVFVIFFIVNDVIGRIIKKFVFYREFIFLLKKYINKKIK